MTSTGALVPRSALGPVVSWLLVVGTGFAALARYEATPGPTTRVVQFWPADSGLPRDGRGLTLVMFVHPRCPCSRAGLAELEALVARIPQPPVAVIVFVRPEGTAKNWGTTTLSKTARAIRGATCVQDSDAVEARRFGVATSGHLLVYDAAGKLKFSGGITPSRGQQGESDGRRIMKGLLAGAAADGGSHPVYGCPLLDSSNRCLTKGAPCPPQ